MEVGEKILPAVGTSLPGLPAHDSTISPIPQQQHPIRPSTHRPGGTASQLRRLQILSDRGRQFHEMSRSRT